MQSVGQGHGAGEVGTPYTIETKILPGDEGREVAVGATSRVVRARGKVISSAPFSLFKRDAPLQVVIVVLVVAFSLSTLLVHRQGGYNLFWDGWVQNIAYTLPALPMMLCARRATSHRTAWWFMAAGVVLNTVGNLVYSYHDQNLNPIPSPAPSDVSYLLSYAAFIIGVALLTQTNLGRVHASVRLDGVIAGLALASLAGLTWFEPVLKVSGNPLQVIVGMSYPLSDLVLIVLLFAGLAPNHYRPNWTTALLIAGTLWLVVGDVISLNQVAANTYVGGTFLDATWVIGVCLFGLAASTQDRRSSRVPATSTTLPRGISLIPAGSGLLAIGVIAGSVIVGVSAVVVSLALSALGLVIIRMVLTLGEERRSTANFQDARTDALTGLPNRRALFEKVKVLCDQDSVGMPGLIFIDLDGFKEVNDALGHSVGDELLCAVSKRFMNRVGDRGLIGRLGGDEFACAAQVGSEEEIVAMAHELLDTLTDPCELEGILVHVGASLGVTIGHDEISTPTELFRSADVAMYSAKNDQCGISIYRIADDPNSRERLALLGDLREAIDAKSLALHYQPTLDMRTGQVRGLEALARWEHPELGMLYPDTFIPMAERAGLMPLLTRAVLEQAIAQASYLDLAGHSLQMSVNISRYDLIDLGLPDFVENVLTSHGFPPERLTLEITESAIGSDPDRAAACVDKLRAKGIRISIDDFGVGYSSMSQLLSLAIDELKVDKSFIIGLCSDSRAQAIVRSATELASALGLSLVAEGIEDEDVLLSLQLIGVDIGQGFFIARPLAPPQLDDFLADSHCGGGFSLDQALFSRTE